MNFMVSGNNSGGITDSELAEQLKEPCIAVEVVYALPDEQFFQALSVRKGSTAQAAVLASGVLGQYPQLNINELKMGIFSKPLDGKHLPLPQDYELKDKDRVEIYRPLAIDPKQARMDRAKKAAKLEIKQKVRNKKKVRLKK
tara:strand:+ start:662 stop:1087 length:426 start_codon:yes stop_codon:yes gene_type:complete